MITKHDLVAAGISGGADSLCLLFVLLEYRKKVPFDLVVVHVNHLIRKEAAEDADFVKVKSAGNQRPGTGDVFSSVLAGAVLNGSSLKNATEKAAKFVRDCIVKSDELDIPHSNGVCFEEILGKLVKR